MPDPGPGILVVRHGHTLLNEGEGASVDRIRGWADVPLSPQGRQDALRLARELKGYPIELVIASDLSRAAETGKAIARVARAPLVLSTAYRPWNLGDLQGQESKQAAPAIKRWARDQPAEAVPGGESFDSFRTRFLSNLTRLMADVEATGKLLVAVASHYRGLKLIEAWMAGGGRGFAIDYPTFFDDSIKPGAVLALTPSPDGWSASLLSRGFERAGDDLRMSA